ncbi:hypothetical protein PTTG_03929 [Puccinia triticina 1-1 BBBD Race 1]|uniref:Uncharacterized protein n=1 Tax=Puccinia triticina (isolate 1-1 / race 1 (BBBD)) TaxID=630390 RepID=A0A180GK17_PUCT1|nr:hypothetical protein PTTG_03929 [Puccinia triticina 1-1 BBBD Race 1]
MSSLNLIVKWLTDQGNYDLWRNSTVSKQEVAEQINAYLTANGAEDRQWRGIKQQVSLEQKFCRALAWQNQTGQGILDKANELARQLGDNPDDGNAKDILADAVTRTEAELRKICKYYYELEPIMIDRPSAIPLDSQELGDQDKNLAGALNLEPIQEGTTTPPEWILWVRQPRGKLSH